MNAKILIFTLILSPQLVFAQFKTPHLNQLKHEEKKLALSVSPFYYTNQSWDAKDDRVIQFVLAGMSAYRERLHSPVPQDQFIAGLLADAIQKSQIVSGDNINRSRFGVKDGIIFLDADEFVQADDPGRKDAAFYLYLQIKLKDLVVYRFKQVRQALIDKGVNTQAVDALLSNFNPMFDEGMGAHWEFFVPGIDAIKFSVENSGAQTSVRFSGLNSFTILHLSDADLESALVRVSLALKTI